MQWILLLALGAALGTSFIVDADAVRDCNTKNTCSECIQTPNCMWCGSPGILTDDDIELHRCVKRQGAGTWRDICGSDNIHDPQNYFEMLENNDLTEAGVLAGSSAASNETIVQLKPQRVAMKLRVQEPYSMQVTYHQALDYPVDLYYLMDLSKSMEDDKESLSKLGNTLAEEMQNLTKNFRLGFGSFVDKPVMPYVSTVPSKLVAPCATCAAPYGFRNALPLTTDASRFVKEVHEAPVSGNLDAPEGGFDAIMQAIVCQRDIQWRDEARRLLVFSTDAGFHYAGDGKLGGIVKPNDEECHMDSIGEMYTHSKLLDYPSVSQINHVAKSNQINIIFAVTQEQTTTYSSLSQMIEGSSFGALTEDSSNVVELVKEEYMKITNKIELKDNSTKTVNIRYFSNCSGLVEKETSECTGLRVGDKVDFRLEVTVLKCPEDRNEWNQIIGIYPVGLRESLIIDLEMLGDCQCEQPQDPGYIPNADACNGQGTFMCGVCMCDEEFFGHNCECSVNTPWGAAGEFNTSSCREPGSQSTCSGRGTCFCGECKCKERPNPLEMITEKYCQCTNFLCERHNGVLCSGPEHGKCVCNECECEPGWTGPACNCEDTQENCINPDNGLECSGQGECECNKCKCFVSEEGRFSGKWCEDCPLCGTEFKCLDFKDCVQCRVWQTGPLSEEGEDEACGNCTLLTSSYTGRIVANYTINVTDLVEVEREGERSCVFYDENDCRFTFVYGYNENKEPVVRVQKTLECPPILDFLGVILGVVGAIVAVGLVLIVMWKVFTTITDRREFARFQKESRSSRWSTCENPIYKQATSTFVNPMFQKEYAGKKT